MCKSGTKGCNLHFPVEIKSAATFSTDFVKGLEKFRTLVGDRVAAEAVLYNGEQEFSVRGVRIFNPLHPLDLYKTLTTATCS